ncbi:hypothetical protein BDZ89DRAFT_1147522 [Hymenopellis radicata]|nr:hypothetical protein BDZ89DRAFT_1147522 [Hymenopellis radicata]
MQGESRSLGQSGEGQLESTMVGIALDPDQYGPYGEKQNPRTSPAHVYNCLLAFLVLFELQHDDWFKAIPAEYLLELDDAGDLMDTRLVPAPVDGIPLLELDDEGEIIQESVISRCAFHRETFLPEDKSSDSDSDTESEVSLAQERSSVCEPSSFCP